MLLGHIYEYLDVWIFSEGLRDNWDRTELGIETYTIQKSDLIGLSKEGKYDEKVTSSRHYFLMRLGRL
jgi:hypothetical protein